MNSNVVKKGRGGNSRSQNFAKTRAAEKRNGSSSISSVTSALGNVSLSGRANAPKRLEWEGHGPGINCQLKEYPHSFAVTPEATILSAVDGDWWVVDIADYFTDKMELHVAVKSIVIAFDCSWSDGFYDVVRASSMDAAKECFSTLTSKRFEKSRRMATQFLAPSDLTFAMLKKNMFFFVMKFTTPLVTGKPFITRRVWGHSNKMPEVKIPSDILHLS